MPNRLSAESSPYLRQHADNPVDWYPWGPEAFERAVAEDRPILLSVGYAACHWCHVMAHESFEDEATAALMNELFVNIKVDREERPDVDAIYMQAVQAMNGHGGWPMTVALTPTGEPYWGGTYFPPQDRHGMPSFTRVLRSVADAWRTRRDAVVRTTTAMRELYENASQPTGPTGVLEPPLLERAFAGLERQHDAVHGGFGGAPKFPSTMSLDFCLRWYARSGNPNALHIVQHSFEHMANGGMYDQVGGGFHRYSVDAEWLVPHFEKMLYDNALLALLGVHLWQVTHDPNVLRVVEETLGWVSREMTDANGGFYSSLDADSEGHEGKFYVWGAQELDTLLVDDAPLMRVVWGVTNGGNFEGTNILFRPTNLSAVANQFGSTDQTVREAMARAVSTLYATRAQRVWPGRDEKILASWNGLMTRAFAEAARVCDRADWLAIAIKNGQFLRNTLVRGDRVMRVHTAGETKVPGFLEDHAAVALAFVALHEATLDPSWLGDARRISDGMRAHFRDTSSGSWYDTADDAETLITRPRDAFDNAVPAGQSLALELMLRFAELDGTESLRTEVAEQLSAVADPAGKWPNGFGHVLGVIDAALFGGVAVAVVGDPLAHPTRRLCRAVAGVYVPTLVMVGGDGTSASHAQLLEGRATINGQATAYVCRNFSCELPATDPTALSDQLGALVARRGPA